MIAFVISPCTDLLYTLLYTENTQVLTLNTRNVSNKHCAVFIDLLSLELKVLG